MTLSNTRKSTLDDRTFSIRQEDNPTISVVVPVQNEAGNILPLYRKLVEHLSIITSRFFIIFSDDGSSDNTPVIIGNLIKNDPNVGIIRLSRNFGHQGAVMAGLDHATGDVVIVMDGDLQHPPELIPKMIQAWRNGSDIVLTRRHDAAATGFFKKATGFLFYSIFNRLTNVHLEIGSADFFLISKPVREALKQCRESTRFHRGLLPWLGFERSYLDYDAGVRERGNSKYNLRKMLTLAFDGICGFSVVPLRVSGVLGLLSVTFSLIYMMYAITCRLLGFELEQGWTSLLSVVIFLAGIQLTILWVHGEYLARVFLETRQRPPYVVREISVKYHEE